MLHPLTHPGSFPWLHELLRASMQTILVQISVLDAHQKSPRGSDYSELKAAQSLRTNNLKKADRDGGIVLFITAKRVTGLYDAVLSHWFAMLQTKSAAYIILILLSR